MDEVSLGKRIQTMRQAAGFTQQQLCQKANLSYSTLTKIERGAIKSPSIFTIQSLAAALGTSLDALIGAGTPQTTPVIDDTPALPTKRTSKSGVRFVYFDLNDCLVRLHAAAFNQLAQDSGQTVDIVEGVYWKHNDAVNRGEMTLDQLNTVWAERLGIMVDWKKYYLNAVDEMPGIRELVEWVADQYHVGILSNTCPGFITALLQAGKVPQVPYDSIVDSSVVHALKPETEMFDTAVQQAGMQPQEILLIDDSRPNLIAAEKLGWRTIWFDSYQPEESIASIRQALEA